MKTFIILTPVYNDWENLNRLLEKINDEAERNNFEFEILPCSSFLSSAQLNISCSSELNSFSIKNLIIL